MITPPATPSKPVKTFGSQPHYRRRFVDQEKIKEYEDLLKVHTNGKQAVLHNEAKPEGYTPINRVHLEGDSIWDELKWGRSYLSQFAQIRKNKAQTRYFLTASELEDLCWVQGAHFNADKGWNPPHLYLERHVERRAWEKYGGPSGYKFYKSLKEEQREGIRAHWRCRQADLDAKINALLSSSNTRNNNQSTSTPTKKKDSKVAERRFIKVTDSGDESEDKSDHELPPTSPIETPRRHAPFLISPTKPRDSMRSAPKMPPVAGQSTPVRTPRSSSHRKVPYVTPTKRHQARSPLKNEPQLGQKTIMGPEIVDLTIESEDDVFYNSGPSRKTSRKTRIPNKSSQTTDINNGEIVNISD